MISVALSGTVKAIVDQRGSWIVSRGQRGTLVLSGPNRVHWWSMGTKGILLWSIETNEVLWCSVGTTVFCVPHHCSHPLSSLLCQESTGRKSLHPQFLEQE